jgi:hypothetical protein
MTREARAEGTLTAATTCSPRVQTAIVAVAAANWFVDHAEFRLDNRQSE